MKTCPSCNAQHDRRDLWCSVDCKVVVDRMASINDNLKRIRINQMKTIVSPHRTDMEQERDRLLEEVDRLDGQVILLTAEVERLQGSCERHSKLSTDAQAKLAEFRLMAVRNGWDLGEGSS